MFRNANFDKKRLTARDKMLISLLGIAHAVALFGTYHLAYAVFFRELFSNL